MTRRKKRSGKEKAKGEFICGFPIEHFVGFPLVLQLILAEVLEAEHDPKLIGQYVMEYGEDKEDLWGKFDRDF
ncbi:hypothetical protein F2Q69_00005356 [Brassica cretica]|uniref:Uncharacterized protein n=1 Tax=Brassica cretica TaxID=69181 RepID=A0A8S9NNL7_BRACR|nr:hypothetical protein F2Q69_00005356 [Brassica cretica]